MTFDAETLILHTDSITAKCFAENGNVYPMYVAYLADGTTRPVIVSQGFRNERTKDGLNQAIRREARMYFGDNHVGGVLVTEGWMSELPRYARHLDIEDIKKLTQELAPPSQQAGRVEAILYMAEARTQNGIKRAFGTRHISEHTRTLGSLAIVQQTFLTDNQAAGFRQMGFGILSD